MKVVDAAGNKNYTFKVDSPNATLSKFYNLVLQENVDGYSLIKLIEYQMTNEFADKFNKGEKSFQEFEGSYFYKILANYATDPRSNPSGDDGYGSSSGGTNDGNTGYPTGTGSGPGGVGQLGSGGTVPCPEGGGPLSGSGGTGPGGGSGTGGTSGGTTRGISCVSYSVTYWCSEHQHLGYDSNCTADTAGGTIFYTDCGTGGSNKNANSPTSNNANRGGDTSTPCGGSDPGNTNIGIITPASAEAILLYQLMQSSLAVHNAYVSLNSHIKDVVNSYNISVPHISDAASFFITLQINNQMTWFSQQSSDLQIFLFNSAMQNHDDVNGQIMLNFEINYLIQHPNFPFGQFNNWFGSMSEGQDGNFDQTFWDNPSLNFPQQSLPSYSDFFLAYPSHYDDAYDTPLKIYSAVGGQPLSIYYASGNENTCALRVSRALNYSGVSIPHIPGKTFEGDDGNYYFLGAANLLAWMKKTFGAANHHFTGAEGGINGINFPSLLQGIQGIYFMVPVNPSQSGFAASGHTDIIESLNCDGNCYSMQQGELKIFLSGIYLKFAS